MKRYVVEFINDKRKELPENLRYAWNEYSSKVVLYLHKGYITNIEAMKMLVGIEDFELSSGLYKERFLHW